jgi:polyhydroxyalkanoate synthesis regulator phasin
MANLEDDQIEFINKLIADYIQTKLNESLIKKGEMDLTEPEAIVKEVWNRLRETHKLRVVK